MEVNLVKLPVPEGGYGTARTATDSVPPVGAENSRVTQKKDMTGSGGKDKKTELNENELKVLTSTLNKFMTAMNTDLEFAVHEKTHRMMVKVVDVKTQKVLKEFPPHELLDTLAAISEYVGAILDKKA